MRDHGISQEDFRIVECSDCKFRFTQNPPDESVIGPYYETSKYISHSADSTTLINRVYYAVRDNMLAQKYKLIRQYTDGKNFIDIGCGLGYFLNYIKQKNNTVFGIEKSESTAAIVRDKFNITVESPEFFLENKIEKKYDVVSMWHVLEHLYNPKNYISSIQKIIHDQSIIIIALPNHQSWDGRHYKEYWAGYDVPRHLWHFDASSINTLMSDLGFRCINMHRLPYDAFYVSLLSERYRGNFLSTIRAMFAGVISSIKSWMDVKQTSSIIYIYKKK